MRIPGHFYSASFLFLPRTLEGTKIILSYRGIKIKNYFTFFFKKKGLLFIQCSVCMFTCIPEEGIWFYYRWL